MIAKTEIPQLKIDEGLRLKAYFCPAGKLTIGYGHNISANPTYNGKDIPNIIDEELAESLLQNDVKIVVKALTHSYPYFAQAMPEVQNVLVNMGFQMGVPKLMTFKATLHHLERSEFKEASICMLDSKWAKQTPSRAKRLANRIFNCQSGGEDA